MKKTTEENVSEVLQTEASEAVKEIVAKSSSKQLVKEIDLSQFDNHFEEFWRWETTEEGMEFHALIKKIEAVKDKAYNVVSAHIRLPAQIEKDIKFIPYSSMQTQFNKLGVKEGSVVYIKHIGWSKAQNFDNAVCGNCVVRKLK